MLEHFLEFVRQNPGFQSLPRSCTPWRSVGLSRSSSTVAVAEFNVESVMLSRLDLGITLLVLAAIYVMAMASTTQDKMINHRFLHALGIAIVASGFGFLALLIVLVSGDFRCCNRSQSHRFENCSSAHPRRSRQQCPPTAFTRQPRTRRTRFNTNRR